MRVTPLARRLGSLAVVLTLGAGLSACSDDSKSAESSSSATDDATEADPGGDSSEAPVEASLEELSAAGFYPAVMKAMREEETFAFSTTSGDDGGETVSGQARFSDEGMAMKAASTGSQAMEIIMLDKVMYMKAPDMGTGDKFLKVDLSDPDSLFGMLGKATDPEAMFKAMETPQKLELVGEEEIDGVDTNHYRITIDSADYMTAMGLPASMAQILPEKMVTEMWVDGDNLPRKFSQTTETPSPSGGKPVSTTSEGYYTDYGLDVDIKAPPADQISDQVLPGMG